MIVIMAMYVLKSSVSACIAMLDETLLDVGYKPSREDMDIWMDPKTNPQNGKD